MARNGSGTYSFPATTWDPAVGGVTATTADWNTREADVAAALTQSVSKDGQTPMTGNLQMENNRITGLAAAVALTDATTAGDVQSGRFSYLTGPSGADTVTASLSGLVAYAAGEVFQFIAAGQNSGPVTLNVNSIGAKAITKSGAVPLAAGEISSGQAVAVMYDGTQFQLLGDFPSLSRQVRQSVVYGPVDSSGLPSFGGSTGSTTVTASGTLVLSAAFGQMDRVVSTTNPSWTGLSTNGTMYLYVDIASTGVVSTGSTTLAPAYQWGGAYSTTNNQNTFNIQEMTMKVGNGSTASQVWRVFVGEVTVAGAVVSAITWYALMGRYDSGFTATLPAGAGAQPTKTHSIGLIPQVVDFTIECTTTDLGWPVGTQIHLPALWSNDAGVRANMPLLVSRTAVTLQVAQTGGMFTLTSGAVGASLTAASWKYKFTASRGW